ncbi:major facilitator superfamily MFS_1 [Sulfolobus islandicus Y.G.57.14]|jgi:MFS family permease|uniref:Major facilitator superfamily MFS_1 n=2 Tax=Saccharolobus islandicus TaxID=43080 RepID=C3N9M6_SACI7|nr:MFS transporter [Sulfolobus islandicus]ACP46598.1 major facilitator superfamily MFS_1 [Sulfolobus islandicus Y.G.57.14]ACP47702.1 major facilitator superfamily MFS_1 [Sulfolobus islandicus Y.N.15.51]
MLNEMSSLSSREIKLIFLNFMSYTFLVYNYSILLVFNSPYISQTLFKGSYVPSLLGVYGLLLVDVIMRVPGAYVLGPISDRYGRKVVTRMSSLGSALPLVVVALIPDPSPSLLVLLYMIQGFFTGGLSTGITVVGVEDLPERHRGWFGGSGFAVGGSAYLLASIVFFMIITVIGSSNYTEIGWRIMFLTSLLILPFGLLMPESLRFRRNKERVKSPAKVLISSYKRQFILASTLTAFWASMNALVNVMLPNFLYAVDHLSKVEIGYMSLIYSVIAIISAFIGGELSERIGRKKISMIGGILGILLSPVFILMSISSRSLIPIFVSILAFVSVFGGGGIMSYVNENFPTKIRSTGVSLSWNIGFLVGNFIPLLLTAILYFTSITLFPLVEMITVLILGALISSVSTISHETKGNIEKE